jgi:hypothetical protein
MVRFSLVALLGAVGITGGKLLHHAYNVNITMFLTTP